MMMMIMMMMMMLFLVRPRFRNRFSPPRRPCFEPRLARARLGERRNLAVVSYPVEPCWSAAPTSIKQEERTHGAASRSPRGGMGPVLFYVHPRGFALDFHSSSEQSSDCLRPSLRIN